MTPEQLESLIAALAVKAGQPYRVKALLADAPPGDHTPEALATRLLRRWAGDGTGNTHFFTGPDRLREDAP